VTTELLMADTINQCGPRVQTASNDEAERRGASPTTNDAALSQSSIFSFSHRRHDPRSLRPIVRCLFALIKTICAIVYPPWQESRRRASTP
jgi:hypothetical protein